MNLGKLGVLELQGHAATASSRAGSSSACCSRAPCARRTDLLILDEPVTGLDPARHAGPLQDAALPERAREAWRSSWSRTTCEGALREAQARSCCIGRDGLVFRHGGRSFLSSPAGKRFGGAARMKSAAVEMFAYPFIVRAFAVGILVSLCAALLGVPLVLKRYSMIGDGLCHVSRSARWRSRWPAASRRCAFSVPVVVASRRSCCCASRSRAASGRTPPIAVLSASALAIGVVVTASHDRHDHGCGQLYVRQHPRDVARRTWRSARDAGGCACWRSLSSSTIRLFCRHVRRELCPRDGRDAWARTSRSSSRAHGADGRARHAHDGRDAASRASSSSRRCRRCGCSRASARSCACAAGALRVVCFCLGLTGSYLLSTPVGATVVVCDLAAFLLCCLIGPQTIRSIYCKRNQ